MIKDLLSFEPQSSPYTTKPPFSFTYGGKLSTELLGIWEQKHLVRKLDDQRTERLAKVDVCTQYSKTWAQAIEAAVVWMQFPLY